MSKAIQKLKNSLVRLDSYGAPPEDSALMVDHQQTEVLFELVDGEEGPRVTLGDLREVVSEAEKVFTWNENFDEAPCDGKTWIFVSSPNWGGMVAINWRNQGNKETSLKTWGNGPTCWCYCPPLPEYPIE